MRNGSFLLWKHQGIIQPSHFRGYEFENSAGFVMVDDSVVSSLELTRASLIMRYQCECQIMVTSTVRTQEENEYLARAYGWTDQGGTVARDSRHLPKYGGIAVDIYARYRDGTKWVQVPAKVLGLVCESYFSYVKADYMDGHVHADNRQITEG